MNSLEVVRNYDLELNETNNYGKQPSKVQLQLKPHQLTSLYKAIEMENKGHLNYRINENYFYSNNYNQYTRPNPRHYLSSSNDSMVDLNVATNIGILGDKVGYGKTLLALSLIAANDTNNIYINPNFLKTYNTEDFSYNYLTITYKNKLICQKPQIINTTLVVVPRGPVFIQWEETAAKHTTLKVLSITNLNFIKNNIPKFTGNNEKELVDYFESFDLVLIKNTTLKVLCDYFNELPVIKNWKRIIIDEAHDIASKMPYHMQYHYTWLISGTYTDLLKNTNASFYTLGMRKLLNDNLINLVLVKNSENFIKSSFDIPEPIERFYLCKLPADYLIARKFLNSSVMEKINANDFAGAIRELGGKNETEDNIIELISKELKKDLKNKERERAYINDLDINDNDKEQKLKKLDVEIEVQMSKIADLTERIKSLSTNNCIICMDTVKNPIMLECTHLFCGGCIMKWMDKNNNCPYCRNPIASYNKLIAIVNTTTTATNEESDNEFLSKEDKFISIINKNPKGKFLVFTKNDNGFENIKNKMTENKITYEFLKGNTQHMMNVLDRFKSGDVRIILLNTQYAGSGIDINYATDVIIYHSMGIDKQQAIGRAQRAGRKDPLRIHNLCYEHEL